MLLSTVTVLEIKIIHLLIILSLVRSLEIRGMLLSMTEIIKQTGTQLTYQIMTKVVKALTLRG